MSSIAENDDYRAHLLADEHGRVLPRLASNLYWTLRGHQQTRAMFGISKEENVVLIRRPWWIDGNDDWVESIVTRSDYLRIRMFLEQCGLRPTTPMVQDAVELCARDFNC